MPVFKKKRYLFLVLVPVFVVFIVLAPLLLSSSSALHFFVTAVNKNIPGRLSIDSWLIGWQQGILCQNVVYTYPEKGITVSVPSLTSNRGLIALALAPKNLGLVQVDSPVVELSGLAVQTFFAEGKTAAPETRTNQGAATPVWERLFVTLQSRNGQVKMDLGGQDNIVELKKVSVDSTLATGIAVFAVGFQAMEQGFVEAAGTLNLPAHEHGWLETIIAETKVHVSSLQLRELLRTAAVVSTMPRGEGMMNADFKLKMVGLDAIEYSGLAEITDCSLHGGFLGEDRPFFQKIHLVADEGRWTTNGWSLKGFELVSDTMTVHASAAVLPETTRLAAQGIVNLPVLFDQVPRLLKVNESTFLESGTVDFAIELAGSPHPEMKLKAKASGVGGIYQDQRFSWDSPVALLLNGEMTGADLQISALQFDSPFARVKGSGNVHSFAMDAELDMEKAFADIETLFQLDLTGSGKMEMTMTSSPAEKGRFTVDTDLSISDFMLRRHDQQVIPLHQFSLLGSFNAPDTFIDQRKGEIDIQIALSSWLGEVFLAMNGEKPAGLPFKGYCTTDSELDLAQITTLLQAMNILAKETRMTGTMQLQAAGFAGGGPVEIRDLSAEITDFILEGHGAHFAESRIKLAAMQPVNEEVPFLSLRKLQVVADKETFFRNGAGLNLIDFAAHQLILHNIQLQAEAVKSTVDSLVIPDWRDPYNDIRSQFSMSADLEKMTKGFQALGLLSGERSFSGVAQAAFNLTEKDSSSQQMDMHVQIAGFGLTHRDNKLVDAEEVDFSSRLHGQAPSGAMTVDELKLRSGTLGLDLTGSVSITAAKQMLELNGTMEPALDRVAAIIGKEFDIDLRMKGRPEEQIVIRYPLWSKPGEGAGESGFFSTIHAESLVINGIDLRGVTMPFHFDNRKLHMELSSSLNEGRFELVTDTDLSVHPAVVKSPENSQVMIGVRLDDSLASKLLSRIHPLFGGLAKPSGLIDLRLDSLWWPIGKDGTDEANFVVIFDAREIHLESTASLQNILAVFGLEKERLQLRDNEIYCIGDNGRIKCSPVRVMAGEVEIIIGGSVYLDRSLDYAVEVPITKKLVNDEGYEILQGTTVKVAVKGTTENPSFDRETVVATIQSLMKKSADELKKESPGPNKPL